jgi:hypothetical protein
MKARRPLLTRGVPSPGWSSVLTGLALLVVASLLGYDADQEPVLFVAGVAVGVAAVWMIERGLRAEYARRPRD